MCTPGWPTTIGKKAFEEYAVTRGWSPAQIEKAWAWCTARQAQINAEVSAERTRAWKDEQAERERLRGAEKQPDPPCLCQCPRCKWGS